VILEEAAAVEPSEAVEGWQLLVLSARSEKAITTMARRLAVHLKQHPELNLADVAYTLQEGRKAFAHRLSLVCRCLPEAIALNDLERAIAAIWQDLIGIEQIGVHDNFCELGGHSLLAIQRLSRLRQTFQVEVSVRSLFEKPTIAGQGEVIEEALIKETEALTEEEVASLQTETKIS
jgi:hypothetical protein